MKISNKVRQNVSSWVFCNKLRCKLVNASDYELKATLDEVLREMNRRIKGKTEKRFKVMSE